MMVAAMTPRTATPPSTPPTMAPMFAVLLVEEEELGGRIGEGEAVGEDRVGGVEVEIGGVVVEIRDVEVEIGGVEADVGGVEAVALVARLPAALWDVVPDTVGEGRGIMGMAVRALELEERRAVGGGATEAIGSGGVDVSPL